ncbi:LRR receptor-like serine/threonine-protein kinase EFR [Triticum dicoccoides]|uniref:LRR receptor-like serine/threonine-protein kinase EFR n=1 Tax=Triticum dicoccoides TaxID=85692 RepID=UPI0018918FCA|nr:LRR receptor-like serine/threonine-protein kinase EFR [Triticum dicoccoides]
MHRSVAKLLALLLATAVFSVVAHAAGASCLPRERDALLAFKQAANDTYDVLASWQRRHKDCCRWWGVTCSKETGHVIELDFGYTLLDGKISPSLLSLEHLEYLNLNSTNLLGPDGTSLFPEFLCSLSNLRHLDLSWTLFSGRLPAQLANLSNLEYLDLSYTQFSGRLPAQLANLSNLEYLDLSYTQFSGRLPAQLANLSNLEYLDLSFTSLDGSNGFISCKNLRHLGLRATPLSGRLPPQFFILSKLEYLDLFETSMSGILPPQLGNLSNLRHLDLGYMQDIHISDISCSADMFLVANTIPSLKALILVNCSLPNANQSLTHVNLTKLEQLDLSSNYLGHRIETCWFWNLTSIKELTLDSTYLYGPFPDVLGVNCTILHSLALGLNQLSGQIPTLPRSLSEVDLSMNSLSGPLPSDFGAPYLTVLSLSSNYITGYVPRSICELQNLIFLDLSQNRFAGEFPRCSSMPNLAFLHLSNNSFSGSFPPLLQNCANLFSLDLAMNEFDGALPVWIGDLVNLRFLQLNHNMFYGHIPANITSLVLLQLFSLASNNISGSIPSSLSKLIAMTLKHPPRLESMLFKGTHAVDILSVVMMKQQELKFRGDAVINMVSIDLSLNHLTGEIPDEITSLNGLLSLNLSWNHLSHKIPVKIGDMKSLESLDLSRNNISGEIPTSLSDLTYLSSLDLSYNNLAGRIPTGRQLDTLYAEDPSMYDGNSRLCGPHLQRNCSGNSPLERRNQQRSENAYDPVMFFYIGLTSGFVVGLWLVFCALLFKRAWRHAYFRLFDKLCHKVYVFVIVIWGRINTKATAS